MCLILSVSLSLLRQYICKLYWPPLLSSFVAYKVVNKQFNKKIFFKYFKITHSYPVLQGSSWVDENWRGEAGRFMIYKNFFVFFWLEELKSKCVYDKFHLYDGWTMKPTCQKQVYNFIMRFATELTITLDLSSSRLYAISEKSR